MSSLKAAARMSIAFLLGGMVVGTLVGSEGIDGPISAADILRQHAPTAQVVVRGTAISVDSTFTRPGGDQIYGVFHVEIEEILKGSDFLEDTLVITFVGLTGASTLGSEYRVSPIPYTPIIGKPYLFMVSGKCECCPHRRLEFVPIPISESDSLTLGLSQELISWSAFQDTFQNAMASVDLGAIADEADLCVTALALGAGEIYESGTQYTADMVVQEVHYQPSNGTVQEGDTLLVERAYPRHIPSPAFAGGDTLLVFCTQVGTNWRLTSNSASVWHLENNNYVARATPKGCVCSTNCTPYPTEFLNQGAVENVLSQQ